MNGRAKDTDNAEHLKLSGELMFRIARNSFLDAQVRSEYVNRAGYDLHCTKRLVFMSQAENPVPLSKEALFCPVDEHAV